MELVNTTLFEAVQIKIEPDKISDCPQSSLDSVEAISKPIKRSTKGRCLRSRTVPVQPEELIPYDANLMQIPGMSGANKPIAPVCVEDTIPQCRFCLRRVAQPNLQILRPIHKTKAIAALKIKIFLNDAYPMACCNCLNLLDIILDFREAAIKARNLLLNERSYLKGDEWDKLDNVETIANCRAAVERHKNQIGAAYEDFLRRRNRRQVHDEIKRPEEQEIVKPIPVQSTDKEVGSQGSNVIEANNDEDDYVPDSDSSSEDTEVDRRETKKSKRNSRKNKPLNIPKPIKGPYELCDICGQRVCTQSAEGHKNRHLGIKPYTCPSVGCGMTFHSRFNQGLHVKRIHPASGIPTQKCDICGKVLRGKPGVLNSHKRQHSITEKSHVCQLCGKAFTLKRYLRQHAMVHSEEFPHKCSYCGKRFNNKWSMRTHERNMHEKRSHVPVVSNEAPGMSTFGIL
ncbi:zinc finger protein 506-like [Topomyia yanbarensis]|uniref:zinc finger protein 506-like n=1 Tax=Topomyia yanbarensis TaxID=2498891 RepID=UPI00273B2642|nr:zinc finger protein 506-like [Topomyia yanbarensis]